MQPRPTEGAAEAAYRPQHGCYDRHRMPTTTSGGLTIHYEDIGEGEPIVLVHGFTSSFDANWRRPGWIDFLLARGRRVVGLDCRGHGGSDAPHDSALYSGNQMP